MDYMTTRQAAEKWGVSIRRVQAYLTLGRIDGAEYFGQVWMIPASAKKPEDGRVNNRRQPKKEDSAGKNPARTWGPRRKTNNGNEEEK